MAFELPDLGYAQDALEPHIDGRTMGIHHGKHHAGYTAKLNAAIEGTDLENNSIDDILSGLDMNNAAVRNNGGGHYNHSLFWNIISPNGGGDPHGKVAELINSTFNDFDSFKSKFSTAAMTRFGSGWAWLCQIDNHLEICSTANQDNPLMPGICNDKSNPIIGIDVWEHAYYLKYQNKRAEYIDAFFNVVDWNKVNDRIS